MHTFIDYLEYVCITWFTLEFGIKLLVSPNKLTFFLSLLNWIDMLATLWFYFDILYNTFILKRNAESHPAWDLFGIFRILRLFRLFNHHPGLKVIIASLKASAGILKLLFIFLLVAIIIFASLIFYSEKLMAGSDGRNGMSSTMTISDSGTESKFQSNNDNQFISIIEAIWFAIASLTTVGFGKFNYFR